ncbi:MAG: hypothetical protein ACYSR5_01880 [Planctomycetota bacterium]
MDDSILDNNCTDAVKKTDAILLHLRIELSILSNHVDNGHDRLIKSLSHLQKSLDNLRATIKYQVFDLEATRRENSDLMTLLETVGIHTLVAFSTDTFATVQLGPILRNPALQAGKYLLRMTKRF